MKTNRLLPLLLIFTVLLALPAQAQQRRRSQGRTDGVALPQRVVPVPQKPAQPPLQPVPVEAAAADAPALPAPALPAPDAAPGDAIPALPAKTAPAPAKDAAPPTPVKGGILLNFQGASLTDVLNYLSEAAGFIIVQDAPLTGTVNVVSKQPVSPDEAVDLLNTVLAAKGYTAIRNERILKIVSRKDAPRNDLPVRHGSEVEKIPRSDEMVTQILPLRYGEAAKLIENLRPLLPENSTITANDSSNSIIMTDTLTNIRRIAQIIQALDTSVDSIATIHIYPLEYADAKELATTITQLFTPPGSNSQNGGRGGRGGGQGGFFAQFGGFGGPGGPGGGAPQTPQSEAKQAETHIVAVADEQSNSLVVSAPDKLIPIITEVIGKLDMSGTEVSESHIFHLEHADAVETAATLTTLLGDSTTQNNQNGRNNQGNRGGFPGFGPPQQNTASQKSSRALQQSKVVAVGDPRTNSLLVSASRDTMMSISEMVGRLDASDAKKQHVYIYPLQHADADNVAMVIRGMLGDPSAQNSASQSAGSRLTNRASQGATMDTSEFSGSNSGRGGGR